MGATSNPVSQALTGLQVALDDPATPDEVIRQRITDVRTAREKARRELDAAQKDLRLLLTAEQDAVLVGLGYLD